MYSFHRGKTILELNGYYYTHPKSALLINNTKEFNITKTISYIIARMEKMVLLQGDGHLAKK